MEKFKAHILVVDDDDGIRELVKEYLSQNEYLVTSSNSAEDALEKVESYKAKFKQSFERFDKSKSHKI